MDDTMQNNNCIGTTNVSLFVNTPQETDSASWSVTDSYGSSTGVLCVSVTVFTGFWAKFIDQKQRAAWLPLIIWLNTLPSISFHFLSCSNLDTDKLSGWWKKIAWLKVSQHRIALWILCQHQWWFHFVRIHIAWICTFWQVCIDWLIPHFHLFVEQDVTAIGQIEASENCNKLYASDIH